MPSLLGLGDNTFDVYLDHSVEYPGGNAVNVAVFAARLGMHAGYLGRVGEDEHGAWLADALTKEGVDISHLQKDKSLPTAFACVRHVRGDRVFVGSDQSASAKLEILEKDIAYLQQFDMVHTSLYSHLIPWLVHLHTWGVRLSFDFSDEWHERYLQLVTPYIEVAIISADGWSEQEMSSVAHRIRQTGTKVVIATRGSDGVFISTEQSELMIPADHLDVIDTMGAGDGFIAGFLSGYLANASLRDSAGIGVRFASGVCLSNGGWGHGKPLSQDRLNMLRLRYQS